MKRHFSIIALIGVAGVLLAGSWWWVHTHAEPKIEIGMPIEEVERLMDTIGRKVAYASREVAPGQLEVTDVSWAFGDGRLVRVLLQDSRVSAVEFSRYQPEMTPWDRFCAWLGW